MPHRNRYSPHSFVRPRPAVTAVLPSILLFAVCILLPAFAAEAPRVVGWADLAVKTEFEDPFEALTRDQLMSLSIYARVQGLLEQDASKVSEGMRKEADEAAAQLRSEHVDIEGLLARREEIKQLRMKRASATNPELNGVRIRMPGYALPLEYDGKQVTDFLLVPWVGACIHTPPPPPNQIVSVRAAEPFTVTSRFEPVWIEGMLQSGDATRQLFLVDGTADIRIGYAMTGVLVEPYRSGPKADIRPAQH